MQEGEDLTEHFTLVHIDDILVEETENYPHPEILNQQLFPDKTRIPERLWIPMFGTWRVSPHVKGRLLTHRIWQSVIEQTPPNPNWRVDRSLGWRGVSSLHESLGIVSTEMIRGIRECLPKIDLQFYPFSKREWATQTDAANIDFDVRHHFEVQVPGTHPNKGEAPCLRFVHDEFGLYDRSPASANDLFWVPSRWCSWVLRQGGEKQPIYVVPHGVDASVFSPLGDCLIERKSGIFRFLFVGTSLSRKGFDILLDAWQDARPAGSELIIKVLPTAFKFTSHRLRDLPPDIRVIDTPLSKYDVAALYRSCDALIAPSRAEGFGMPMLEAMSCGLPPIIPYGSAMEDFCSADSGFSIASRPYRVQWYEGTEVYFLEPDRDALANLMCSIPKDNAACLAKGQSAINEARALTWRESGARFLDAFLT